PNGRRTTRDSITTGQPWRFFESADRTHSVGVRELRPDAPSGGEKRLGRFQGRRPRFALERPALCHDLSGALQSRPRCREFDLARTMGSGKTPRFSRAFPAALRRSPPALAPLRRCAQRKLELGANFFWRRHAADGLEHAPRRSWSRTSFRCE